MTRRQKNDNYDKINNIKIIPFVDFINQVLIFHINLRTIKMSHFLNKFADIDIKENGILNEEEFLKLIKSFQIFDEEKVDKISQNLLDKIDPFEHKKITFSDCVNFLSTEEYIKSNDGCSGVKNDKIISIMDKICSE